MRQSIAQAYDLTRICDPAQNQGVVTFQTINDFTDDFQIPLHDLPQSAIGQIVLLGTTINVVQDLLARSLEVMK